MDITHTDQIKDDQHGTLVSEHSIGVYHDHYYIYHLDFDIDGVDNSFVKTNFKTVQVTDYNSSKRKSYWTTSSEVAKTESDAKTKLGFSPSVWSQMQHLIPFSERMITLKDVVLSPITMFGLHLTIRLRSGLVDFLLIKVMEMILWLFGLSSKHAYLNLGTKYVSL